MSCTLLHVHPRQETARAAACWVRASLAPLSTMCVLSAGFDTKMWASMAPRLHVFEHNPLYMNLAREAVGDAPNTIFHNASLRHAARLPLQDGLCNLTVVDSSLDFRGGYHRERAMREGLRITARPGVVFLDDANRRDEQLQLRRFCAGSYEVRAIRNGFARCELQK